VFSMVAAGLSLFWFNRIPLTPAADAVSVRNSPSAAELARCL